MIIPITGRSPIPASIFPAWVEAMLEENRELRKALAEAERRLAEAGIAVELARERT